MNRSLLARALFLGSITWLSATATPAEPSEARDLCRPRAEVAAELEAHGFEFAHVFQHRNDKRPCGGGTQCWRRLRSRVEELLGRYPEDLFLHRAQQDLVRYARGRSGSDGLVERARRRVEEHPDKVLHRHLLGRIEPDQEKRRAHQEEVLRLDPHFVWSHLELANLGGGDALEHLERFLERCPDRAGEPLMTAYQLVLRGGPVLPPARIAGLRSAVERSSTWRRIRDLPVLWDLEFRAVDVGEHPALRRRVLEDLGALEGGGHETDFDHLMTLRRGYRIAGDTAALTRVEDEALRRFPCAGQMVHLRLERWRGEEDHGRLPAETYELTKTWTKLCPDEILFWRERFAAASELPGLGPETILSEGEKLVEVTEAGLGQYRFRAGAPHRKVAGVLLERGISLDRAAELLARENELRDELYGPPPAGSSRSSAEGPRASDHYDLGWLRSRLLVAGVATAERRLEAAEATLEEIAGELGRLAPVYRGSPATATFDAVMAQYWLRRGDWKLASGSRLDAVTFYLKASSLAPDDEALRRRARELWDSLGGGAEGLRQLAEVAAEVPEEGGGEDPTWVAVKRPLPDFRLSDLDGRVWTLEDFADRPAFINVWATWCAPCRAEIPYLKRLAALAEGRDDLVVLTFNVDDSRGLVAPFVEREEIAYPVILAKSYVTGIRESLALPVSWLVGPGGVIVLEQNGFDADEDPDSWAARTLELLEGLRR